MRSRWIQVTALALCVALLAGSTALLPRVQAGRQRLNMIGNEKAEANTPPAYSFWIQAFGAFRGLITNVAFIRFEQFKEKGQYYDAVQLGRWICALQPRFPTVWEFMAWNLSWNISVTTYTPEERWQWVYNGIKLLRDEGLVYNPRAVNIYKQLAWTFNNKISESMDDFHQSYKCYWAWHMHLLMGAPPRPPVRAAPDEKALGVVAIGNPAETEDRLLRAARETFALNRGASVEEARALAGIQPATAPDAGDKPPEFVLAQKAQLEELEALNQAPRKLADLFAQTPETREMVSNLRAIGVEISDEPLSEDIYWREGGLARTFFQRYRRLTDSGSTMLALKRRGESDAEQARLRDFDRIIGVRERRPAGLALLRFLQRKVLGEVYKMDTANMVELVKVFAPMDWRSPDSQSLYWVTQGLIKGGETVTSFQADKVNTARIIFFSLRNLMDRNNMVFEPDPDKPYQSYLSPSPDLNFIEPLHQAYIRYGALISPDANGDGTSEMFRVGHTNFLGQVISMLYFDDRKEEARKYYEWLRSHYGFEADGITPRPGFQLTLDDYVMKYVYDTIQSPRNTEEQIAVALQQSYDALVSGNVGTYNRQLNRAQWLWSAYMKEHIMDTGPRMKLRDFPDYQTDMLRLWFVAPATSSAVTIHKAKLWAQLPLDLRQNVFDDLLPIFKQECDAWSYDLAAGFPEPGGMEDFRKAHPPREREERNPTAETKYEGNE